MNKRMEMFVNLLDVDHSGRVDMEDVQIAFAKVDSTVKPHGWGWTISVATVAAMLAWFLRGLVS